MEESIRNKVDRHQRKVCVFEKATFPKEIKVKMYITCAYFLDYLRIIF